MHIRAYAASLLGALSVLSVAPAIASADTLAVSCSGTPGVASIVWAASPTGGVAPYQYLWGNGSTSSSQTVAAAPGLSSTTIQVTDASSTVATSSCSATVLAVPTISAFSATPSSITVGQSSVLSWTTSGATSLSISGVGAVSGTMATVTPAVTSTYTLTASNSGGSATSSVTVTVASAGTTTPSVLAQIQALLQQIQALKAQIAQLVMSAGGNVGGTTGTTTPDTIPGARFCLELGDDHGRGERGDDVSKIQRALASDPSLYPEGQVTGFFGTATSKAIQRLQARFGISATGFVGPQTRSLFKSHCGEGLMQFTNGSTTVAVPPGQFKKLEDKHEGKGRDHEEDDN